MGLCSAGPLVSVSSQDVTYKGVAPEDAPEIVQSLQAAKPVERLRCRTDVPFFTRQKKIVLENCGAIDPERVEEYIAAEGYAALHKALTTMTGRRRSNRCRAAGCEGVAEPAIRPD